jgi:class 3 adenylate cyclase
MRCGAAVGDVLFIAEDPLNPALVHAIGDAINLAARLQSSADPNSLVVSNRLHTSYFRDASELVEFNPDAKNMGTKKAWKKTFA